MTEPGVHSFAEIADELAMAAQREAMGLEELEVIEAKRERGDRLAPIAARSIEMVRKRMDLIVDAHKLMIALVPHEDAVRALLGMGRGR